MDAEEIVQIGTEEIVKIGKIEESYIGRILDGMNGLYKMKLNEPRRSTPKFHPRRHHLYRSFTPNNDMFFRLRSQGVTILTAYFLCDNNNVQKILKQLQEKDNLEKEDALSLIKNI